MNVLAAVAVRYLLVSLVLPFGALDKIPHFEGAKSQAKERAREDLVAAGLSGLCIETLMPIAILVGIADRFAAFVLVGYGCATAGSWKTFWRSGDLWKRGDSTGRALFLDFTKNLSLAGGCLMLAFGLRNGGLEASARDPLASSRRYLDGEPVGALLAIPPPGRGSGAP